MGSVSLLFALLALNSCKKMDRDLFPLVGFWKPEPSITTRIQYTSGGQTYDKAYTAPTPASTVLLEFKRDGTYAQGSVSGPYSLETINGETRVRVTNSSGGSQVWAYSIKDNVLSMSLVSPYEGLSSSQRLTMGKTMAQIQTSAFPGISAATSVQDIRVTSTYLRQ